MEVNIFAKKTMGLLFIFKYDIMKMQFIKKQELLSMLISNIDPNLASLGVNEPDIFWTNALDSPFSLHGVFYDKCRNLYARVPEDVTTKVGKAITNLSKRCAGGRLRFITNSPYVAIKASIPATKPMPHMSITASHGFSLYANGRFECRYSPTFEDFINIDYTNSASRIFFAESKRIFGHNGEEKICEIYFPLYCGVFDLFIGLKEGSTLKHAPDYKIKKPVVFYGSSITQGACVSRPGNDYLSILSRRIGFDYVNLGFSGSGNAEKEIIDYMLSIDASVYAYDYNLYDSRPERVLPPHTALYERIRNARPTSAVLLYDKPCYEYDTTSERRRNIIYETYKTAKSRGDDKIGFVEAMDMFGCTERDNCTVDTSHPNDLGASRIADAMEPVLRKMLSEYI